MREYIQKIQYAKNEFLSSWKPLSENKIIQLAVYGSVVLGILGLILPVFWWTKLPPALPLWFSRPWGNDRLASPITLFLLPISTLIWTGIDIFISARYIKEHLVFCQILAISSFVVSFLASVELIKIIFMII